MSRDKRPTAIDRHDGPLADPAAEEDVQRAARRLSVLRHRNPAAHRRISRGIKRALETAIKADRSAPAVRR